ncbi:GAF domain-containing protein [Kineococcus xinjiangensis]|uniref:GAF domain-containing protein n=1 Tax=Kineococcus xinjiangensis TaxID=512762 RepID=A0A2S6IUQ5_9ACTN|nr:GAF and ANTAR domain-containing protein [Kineococcus xinjiangensis]PPK97938.1 GAF domain-containing protein [Kineococcus xinjiangensis]
MGTAERVVEVLVELADTLVTPFDVIEMLHVLVERSVELLAVDAAGLVIADSCGALQVVAASSEEALVLDLLELQGKEGGPCVLCFTTGEQQVNLGAAVVSARWPEFAAAALAAGFGSVHSLPLRLRDDVLGAVNLYAAAEVRLSAEDVAVGQALADMATIAMLQERAVREQEVVAQQLQMALSSRIVIEQAKGVLAERYGLGVEESFGVLRTHARRTGQRLTDVARSVAVGGELPLGIVRP